MEQKKRPGRPTVPKTEKRNTNIAMSPTCWQKIRIIAITKDLSVSRLVEEWTDDEWMKGADGIPPAGPVRRTRAASGEKKDHNTLVIETDHLRRLRTLAALRNVSVSALLEEWVERHWPELAPQIALAYQQNTEQQ